ncbi:hypothetical protein J6O48_14280 [bacterium]|nr:hypothetical protein [bacterium]MBP3820479.1 hypothetical protein [bacterium]
MKIIEEQIDKNNLRITFLLNELSRDEYYISTRSRTADEIFGDKLKLIDRLNTSCIKYLDSKKAIIRAYAEIDNRIKDLYDKLYIEKAEEYKYNLTPDEKEYLDKSLETYRIRNAK